MVHRPALRLFGALAAAAGLLASAQALFQFQGLPSLEDAPRLASTGRCPRA